MQYKVILIECRLPTHSWVYDDLADACMQLNRLLNAFEEVDDVSAILIKYGLDDRCFLNSELIKNLVL